MKKELFVFCLALFALAGCSKDEENDPQNRFETEIVGTWELTHFDDAEVSEYPEMFPERTTISFAKDGKYSGKEKFGNGEGTYEIDDSVVSTYINGYKYYTYEILSLENDIVEANMTERSTTVKIKAKRVK